MWILSPLSWLLLCGLAFVVGRKTAINRCHLALACSLGAALSVVAMTPWFANYMVGWLEEMPPQSPLCNQRPPDVAVVLAGGVDRFPSNQDDLSVLNVASRRRAEKAVTWWRQLPGRTLVFAGGSPGRHAVPEALLMSRYVQQMGVDPAAIRIESASQDTWQNARNLRSMSPALPEKVVLVTSAMHMRRALYSMEQAGFEVCALGADWRYVPFQRLSYVIPDSSGLTKTESALHELVGLVYYRFHSRNASESGQ